MVNITEHLASERFLILRGDALQQLEEMAAQGIAVDSVVCSPPYFNQRHYGDNPQVELGQEPSVEAYVSALLNIFKAVPLEPWGNLWINIGDKRGKHGELLCVPEQFLVAMQNAGFRLIDKVVWAKETTKVDGTSMGHSMIEPAPGRLNGNGYEPFYRFVRGNSKAWTDTCAVRVPRNNVDDIRYLPADLMECHTSVEGRTLGNVWNIPTGQTRLKHYAVFTGALVERPIAMTCPLEVTEMGPRERIVQWMEYDEGLKKGRLVGKYTHSTGEQDEDLHLRSGRQDTARVYTPRKPVTLGWNNADLPVIRRGIVLDPFAGIATTGEVAIRMGRDFIGIELYDTYASIAEQRCHEAAELHSRHKGDSDSELGVVGGAPNPRLGEHSFDLGSDGEAGEICEI